MSRLRVTVPPYAGVPDGPRYTHPTGHVSRGVTMNALEAAARAYNAQNNIPIPPDFRAIIEDQLCRILPPGNCKYEDGESQAAFVNARISAGDVASGMKVLASVILNQRSVEPAEAARRAAICAACPANGNVEGCFGCSSLEGTISAIVGAKKTPSDHLLKVCLGCHCFNRAQVWVDARDLAAGTSEAQMSRLKLFEGHCWKYKSLAELQESATPQ